ncbi:hypothetical protein ACJRO7_007646 [Eucalyptus globulus]|uniref:CCAAT-binding factor domain-containing protein n=1 Tax=Eucalyptus globulus TaxID=34317 RepID=A0ABD3INY1_EUCGL
MARRQREFVEVEDENVDVEDEKDFDGEEMLQLHEIVARRLSRSQSVACSVLEGAGRTLKGRDLRQVRNAVWRQTVQENVYRLGKTCCCIIAFKVMRNNLDALNVDLQDFFVQLYNLILEYSPGRDQGEVLAEALKMMLCNDRHSLDMQKAAAFIKRLATFLLCFESAKSMAALVTLKHLLLNAGFCWKMILEVAQYQVLLQ